MQLWRFPPAHTISAKPRPASRARPNPKQRALITSYRPPLPIQSDGMPRKRSRIATLEAEIGPLLLLVYWLRKCCCFSCNV